MVLSEEERVKLCHMGVTINLYMSYLSECSGGKSLMNTELRET